MWTVPVVVLLMPAFDTSTPHAVPTGSTCGTWSIVPSPNSNMATASLNGVGGMSDRDVWAVGSHAD
jgi:hypothetical protein